MSLLTIVSSDRILGLKIVEFGTRLSGFMNQLLALCLEVT